MFTKKDLFFSVITGLITGLIAWRIFVFLDLPVINLWDKNSCPNIPYIPDGPVPHIYCIPDFLVRIPTWWFVIIVPVLWILGVNLGYFLGRWFSFFNQFGKFAAIGFTNAAVDFGVLNLLIFYSGVAVGLSFSVFKGISFVVAAVHSYFWNKYWAFEAGKGGVSGQEFSKFFAVTITAFLINVAAASVVVNMIGPQFGLTNEAWANVGAVVGSAVALIASFVGFKMFVFRK